MYSILKKCVIGSVAVVKISYRAALTTENNCLKYCFATQRFLNHLKIIFSHRGPLAQGMTLQTRLRF